MWHYIDRNGTPVLEGDYELASSFSAGIACIRAMGGGVGFVDRAGNTRIRLPNYQEDLTSYHDGRALVSKGRFFGFVDASGNEVVPPSYLNATSFSENFAPVQLREGFRYTFIDMSGKVTAEARFRDLGNLRFGLAPANDGERMYYVDCELRPVFGPFEKAETFWEGVGYVVRAGVEQYIDTQGNLLFRNEWDWVATICVEGRIAFAAGDREGFLDKSGNVVIHPFYKSVDCFSEGVAIADAGREKFAIDSSGNVLFRAQYEWIGNFKGGLARFRENGKYGFIDTAGRVVIPAKFTWVGDFGEGVVPVEE